MNGRRRACLVAAVALGLAACQAQPNSEGQRVDPPRDSTPAPDATVGVDSELVEFYTQVIDWERCREEFECATARVPLDYADPTGDVIELSLLRRPATGDDRIGSLLVNPGGPGASGVEYAQLAGSVVTEPVRDRYDIVGFDPRGVNESSPLDCVDDATLDEYLSGDPSPDTPEEVVELQTSSEEFAAACKSRSGSILPHLGTANVARDLDVLRAALGDSALNYLGKSYGTAIGAHYAGLFPNRVGRMVLDGAIDPTLTGDQLALGQVNGFERALSSFLSWCFDQDDCAVGGTEDEARQAIADLLHQIDAEPLPTEDENRPLTESLAFYGLILPLYLTEAEGYPSLNAALDLALTEGDGTLLLTFADLYLDRTSTGEYQSNQNEVLTVVNCLDHPSAASVEEAQAALATFEAVSPLFGPYLAWGSLGCAPFIDVAPEPTPPAPAVGAGPILVIGTTGDPATPYEWAQSLAEHLESGVLITYEASVHTAYLAGSECVDAAVDAYLLEGTVPPDGLRCES